MPIAPQVFNQKVEGDISSTFTTFSGRKAVPLPSRFLDLKKSVVAGLEEKLQQSWDELIVALKARTDEVVAIREKAIPVLSYSDIKAKTVPTATLEHIRSTGVAVVRGVVPQAEANELLTELREYVATNPLKGFPAESDPKVVYESYWSPPQVKARSHPNLLETQAFMNQIYHTSDENSKIDLETPLSYCDRLQIRPPGDTLFALAPHVDGGGIERWEDDFYRATYREILSGNWRSYDAFDVAGRVDANMDLYNAPGACSVFRAFQSWIGLTEHGPDEGTLVVHPILREATAYWILRPFFQPTVEGSLDGWKLNLTEDDGGILFHGSNPGTAQELTPTYHPHLRLEQTMIPYPTVQPGDVVFWSADTIHGTEVENKGKNDAVVIYIPSVPLTENNIRYVKKQKAAFSSGYPSPDFPGGDGEKSFATRGTPAMIQSEQGQVAMGFKPFSEVNVSGLRPGALAIRVLANEIMAN